MGSSQVAHIWGREERPWEDDYRVQVKIIFAIRAGGQGEEV